jgi:glutamate-1-semialdehyde 2,1-aminomutase
MPDTGLTNSAIVQAYLAKTRGSAALAERGRANFPSGITHDARRLEPYNLYVAKALGGRKWDVDGNEYVDYIGGHGALILGHGDPRVVEAVRRQMEKGTHFGSNHQLEVRWGELVRRLVPSAEKVRFVGTGTEATLLAFRLARAFTGKPKIVRMLRHFHGWHDHVAFGVRGHLDGTPSTGVLDDVAENVILAPPEDVAACRRILESRDDVAAIIMEPNGTWAGYIPFARESALALVRAAQAQGVLVIFDEVVTGFRVAPGGFQELYGVKPDLTTLAKILAGGLPAGAVCGRREIMDLLDFDAAAARGVEKVGHQGTFNANPLSAAAGVACLEAIAEGGVCERATQQAAKLRRLLTDVFLEEGAPWAAYGEHSAFFIFLNAEGLPVDPAAFDPARYHPDRFWAAGVHPALNKVVLALLVNGADLSTRPGGLMSAAHTDADLERTADAVRKAIRMLRAEGELKG